MFQKYSSIENHYQNKFINMFLDRYPEIKNDTFVIEHKYDGANVSICIDENNNVRWAKRSQLIADDDNFMGLQDIKNRYDDFITDLIKWKQHNQIKTLQVIGELFGKGIQKRCNYGPDKYIRFFDMIINGLYVTPSEFRNYIHQTLNSRLIVETFDVVEGLENALEFDPYILNENDSLIEGIVVKPFFNNYFSPVGERFIIKKKNEQFSEKSKPKKKTEKPIDPEVERLKEKFLPFVNKNRVLSVFSKHGEIEDSSQIGNYIKLVIKDAQEDFFKENSEDGIDRNKMNMVYKEANKEIVNILKEYL